MLVNKIHATATIFNKWQSISLIKKISFQGLFHTFKIISSVFIFGFDKIIFFLIQYLFKKILNTIKNAYNKVPGIAILLS